MKSLIIAAIIFAFAMPVYAQDKTEMEVARELASAMQMDSMLERAKKSSAKMVEDQMNDFMASIRNDSSMPAEASIEFEEAFKKYMNTIVDCWSSEEAATIYANALMAGFTKEEALRAIEHYKTEEGKKQLQVVNEASKQLEDYLISRQKIALKEGTEAFLSDVNRMAEKYKNQRKAKVQ